MFYEDTNLNISLDTENISNNNHILEDTSYSNTSLTLEQQNLNNECDSEIDNTTNCLALTVRDNYKIVVFKNFFKKGARISWKVALSMFTINFLNMFL